MRELVPTRSRPSETALDALLGDQAAQPFSYPEVGATAGDDLPDGYRHARQAIELGRGEETFERAWDGLERWQAHRRAGATVHPPGAALAEAVTVVVAVPVAPVWVSVACRVVYVDHQPRRRRFAYGTLPHHVVRGEEAFCIERDDEGIVRFVVSAFLKPRGLLNAAGPIVHAVDQRLVRRYLRGLQRHVTE